ncbi:MAG: enoyl-CoA hydratase/isomerase family protein [Parachlamydiaceae bacterium]|nr:enoyl-CoA hydratase/isomerase family protein [Parachlamydiaceae bacterium]
MNAVTLEITEGVAIVQLADKEARNTFSHSLIKGLIETFKAIETDSRIKVVVIHGYDNYFCCGGTQEELLKIFDGKITFVDLNFYRLLLDCPVPTIAAMQGHAIGGGLALGCFADIILLAEESIYSTNFMKYGFTPGMGATYTIPKKFGESIGHEMLFTAKNYQGGVLKNLGVPLEILKKKEVIAKALTCAEEIARKPRDSLIILKKHLTRQIREEIPKIIEQELEMHRLSFSQQEVKHRIETLFGQ